MKKLVLAMLAVLVCSCGSAGSVGMFSDPGGGVADPVNPTVECLEVGDCGAGFVCTANVCVEDGTVSDTSGVADDSGTPTEGGSGDSGDDGSGNPPAGCTVPDTPVNLSVSYFENNGATISWDNASTKVRLYFSLNNDISKSTPYTEEEYNHPISSLNIHLPTNVVGYYAIVTSNDCGESELSETVVVQTYLSAPEKPPCLTGDPDQDSVTLTWNPYLGSVHVASYWVYWSTSPGITYDSDRFIVSDYHAVHENLSHDTYYYALGAMNADGVVTLSDEISVIVPSVPDPPTGVHVFRNSGDYRKQLGWNISEGATDYKMYYAYNPNFDKDHCWVWSNMCTIFCSATSCYCDIDSAPDTAYFAVAAINSTGEGDLSDIIRIW